MHSCQSFQGIANSRAIRIFIIYVFSVFICLSVCVLFVDRRCFCLFIFSSALERVTLFSSSLLLLYSPYLSECKMTMNKKCFAKCTTIAKHQYLRYLYKIDRLNESETFSSGTDAIWSRTEIPMQNSPQGGPADVQLFRMMSSSG